MLRHNNYLDVLQAWIPAARKHLYRLPDHTGCLCYGPGSRAHWALQANTTAMTAFAVLAVDPVTDPTVTGMERDALLDCALGMLRFTLQGHCSGAGACTDGQSWGHSWISALCIERMMHAVEALDPHLTDDDREGLRRMLVSECDWLTDHYELVAGTVENNKPESNMWNGALLHRTALLYPASRRADEYREKGTCFLVNGISVPSDAECEALLDGKPVRDRHVGANFFDSYACNHHRYLNVGYMVVTLSNAAMLHFSFRHHGQTPPDALYHHVPELWRLVKTCTFPDGRLMRIGGDTRVRYCYCQDYAVPAWLMMRDRYGETDVEAFEDGWLAQVRAERAAGEDGSFLGTRLAAMAQASPLYYVRLEGDRAVSMSMGAYWRRRYKEFRDVPASPGQAGLLSQWHDDYHGACLVRGPERMASWVWRAAEAPQGSCLSPADSDMAEWRYNLAGRVAGTGLITTPRIETHRDTLIDGGFVTSGRVVMHTEQHACEGAQPMDIANLDTAFAALPDGRTVIGIQRARALHRIPLTEVKGLLLQIPNDVFNGGVRRYAADSGRFEAHACPTKTQTRELGRWVNVDDCLGLMSLGESAGLILHRPAGRRITIRAGSWGMRARYGDGLLGADEICLGACSETLTWADPGEVLFDIAFAIRTCSTVEDTATWAERSLVCPRLSSADIVSLRTATVSGADGRAYMLVANLSDRKTESRLETGAAGTVEAWNAEGRRRVRDGVLNLELGASEATLIRLPEVSAGG